MRVPIGALLRLTPVSQVAKLFVRWSSPIFTPARARTVRGRRWTRGPGGGSRRILGGGRPASEPRAPTQVRDAVAIAAGWRGGPRVRFDRAVEHLLAPHRPSAARPEGPLRHGERRHGMDDLPRRGARVAATAAGSRAASRSRCRESTKSEIFCASAAARRISRGSPILLAPRGGPGSRRILGGGRPHAARVVADAHALARHQRRH